MTAAQQQLYTPRVGTTRFAVDMETKRPAKFRSSQQHKSLTTMYDKRPNSASAISIKLDSMAENSTMNGVEETESGDKKKRSGDGGGGQSKKKQKTGKGAGGKKAKGKKTVAKPKVDNRTKWRRRLAIDGNEGHSNGENDGLGAKNYVAVGMTAPEAKKTALENCILVYVPPKRTAAEAKKAAEDKKKLEAAQKTGRFPTHVAGRRRCDAGPRHVQIGQKRQTVTGTGPTRGQSRHASGRTTKAPCLLPPLW